MSLYVVEKPVDPWWAAPFWYGLSNGYEIRDTNARDGEWHAVITLAHEVVAWEGYAVPAFEGDIERIAWERKRRYKPL